MSNVSLRNERLKYQLAEAEVPINLWIYVNKEYYDQMGNYQQTCNGKKPMPTMKLAAQLTQTARLVAAPRADWLNNSDTRNHGMEPGPIANITTNRMTNRMLT
jgi:hypothetical protein